MSTVALPETQCAQADEGRVIDAPLDRASQALVSLGKLLQRERYQFTSVTPETCRRNHDRSRSATASDLRGVFGWSKPFQRLVLSDGMFQMLRQADAVEQRDDHLISRVRFSTMSGRLFVHSAYPTIDEGSVFFGPDSHRFCAFVARELENDPLPTGARIIDIGCGSGVGGILATSQAVGSTVVLSDINERALKYTRINALLAGLDHARVVSSDVLRDVEGRFDLIISNPPYMVDALARAYRDGGNAKGAALSLRILEESLSRLQRGGRLLLYTGSAIVAGRDTFFDRARVLLARAGARYRYEEIDPDVFGEELDQPAYADVERIAAVALIAYAP